MVTAHGSSLADLDDSTANVYICGKTQAGKSTLIKRLTGLEEAIATGDGKTSCTTEITPYRCDEEQVVLIDSPGLFDSGGVTVENAILEAVAEQMRSRPLSLICFVVGLGPGCFDAAIQNTIRKI